ncbi:MAG: HEPN domain-containing protein [Candidatus Freyarchaeota archaeon]|nr:HEPN domain-containing protein [Candidatus Jordarchaeia archaeon]MBS7269582.1 HEPN domain-containing protein [Candidatus Jordarchaeia archaeon]MBS7280735.1 HEPN domain-containing protein [Candidatus Jordarchaeia archaeon]
MKRAEKRFEDGEYDSTVFHASMAVESAANAMILELGGGEAKNHKAISGLAAVLRRVKPELLVDDKYVQLIEKGREIQREVVYTRYLLKLAGKWVTPMEYYTREKATMVTENAKLVVNGIKHFLGQQTKKPKNQTFRYSEYLKRDFAATT